MYAVDMLRMRAGSMEVLSAEVVFNPMQLYINVNEDVLVPDAIHFLYTIRYIECNALWESTNNVFVGLEAQAMVPC